jgi:hypothetical protein
MMSISSLPVFPLAHFLSCLVDLFPFLINHIRSHWIFFPFTVSILQQLQQLHFLFEQRLFLNLSIVLSLFLTIFYFHWSNIEFSHVLILPWLIPRMIDIQQPSHKARAPQIVHGKIATPLILVLEPTKATRLARLLISRELKPDGFAVLGEYCDDVAFGEVKG